MENSPLRAPKAGARVLYWGDETLPAGEYVVAESPDYKFSEMVLIEDENGRRYGRSLDSLHFIS